MLYDRPWLGMPILLTVFLPAACGVARAAPQNVPTHRVVSAITDAAADPSRKAESGPSRKAEAALMDDWLTRWQHNILAEDHTRYCDTETGEELGWLVSPFLNGFYYGYEATHDTAWIDRLMDWSDSWMRRGVKEPDGMVGWPKANGASTDVVPGLATDNLLGEAMALRPAVLMAGVILKTPALHHRYGDGARRYIALSEQVFRKWDTRGCWRETSIGGVWVVPEFGIDPQTGGWTSGYASRKTTGFTLPNNKQNLIASWLLAMYEVTGKRIYRDRAEKWWRQMKSRMKLRDGDKYYVWNYWEPAGPWDYRPDGSTRHWVGVHPNGGYYDIDVEGIVDAFEHGLVFSKGEIDRLVRTNRDFMWNHQVEHAKFERIDGGPPEGLWKDSPGVLWTALAPLDPTLREVFEANHNPASWGGLSSTPWFVAKVKATKERSRR